MEKGTYPTTVALAIGLSNAAANGWKNGKQPRKKTIEALANQLGCSVEELLEDKETPATQTGDGVSPIKQKAIQHITEAIMEASEEDTELIIQMVDVLQKRNNPADNGGAGT